MYLFSDQHVSRVWSDLTPSRSPGLMSPRPRSPEGRKRVAVVGLVSSGKVHNFSFNDECSEDLNH